MPAGPMADGHTPVAAHAGARSPPHPKCLPSHLKLGPWGRSGLMAASSWPHTLEPGAPSPGHKADASQGRVRVGEAWPVSGCHLGRLRSGEAGAGGLPRGPAAGKGLPMPAGQQTGVQPLCLHPVASSSAYTLDIDVRLRCSSHRIHLLPSRFRSGLAYGTCHFLCCPVHPKQLSQLSW